MQMLCAGPEPGLATVPRMRGRVTSGGYLCWVVLCCAWLSGCQQQSDAPVPPAAATPDFALPERTGVAASEAEPQVVRGNLLEDYHLAVTFMRPSPAWEFLKETKAQEIVPDASLGMINLQRQCYMMLICERIADLTPEQYLDLILSSGPLALGMEVKSWQAEVQGVPVLRTQRRTMVQGLPFTYFIQIAQRGEVFYQLIGWSLTDAYPGCEHELLAMADSMQFIADREPTFRGREQTTSDQSYEWIIENSIYRNAAYRFQLTPPEELRLTSRAELLQMNENATAGLTATQQEFYQIYLAEPIGTLPPEEFLAISRENITLELDGAEPTSTETRTIAGQTATVLRYDQLDLEGIPYNFRYALLFHDGYFFRIQSWWIATADAAAHEALLEKSYDSLSWLDPAETATTRAALAQFDPQNAVGPQFSFRQGTFRDFQYGYNLKLPEGIWQAQTGDAIQALNPDASAMFTEVARGVSLLLLPEELEASHEEYHALVRSFFEVPEDHPNTIIESADGTCLVFHSAETVENTPMAYRIVTAQQGKRCLQMIFSSLQSLEDELEAVAAAVVKEFRFPANPTPAVDARPQRLTDTRLGYQVSLPANWNRKTQQIPNLENVGSFTIFEDRDAAIGVMALCIGSQVDESILIEAMSRNMGVTFDPGSRTEKAGTLGNLPARHIKMNGKSGKRSVFLEAWLTKRGNTHYIFFIHGNTSTSTERNAATLTSTFSLID